MVEEGLRKELHAARVELQQRACRVRATPDHSVITFYFTFFFITSKKVNV